MTIIIILLIIALCGFTWSLIRVASEADMIEREIWEGEDDERPGIASGTLHGREDRSD